MHLEIKTVKDLHGLNDETTNNLSKYSAILGFHATRLGRVIFRTGF